MLAVVLVTASCSLFDAGDGDTYVLTRAAGSALPAVVMVQSFPDGRQRTVEATGGSVTFYPRGTFESEVTVRVVWSGAASADSVQLTRLEGSFELLADTVAQTRFREATGPNRTNYRILEDGALLRAIQSFSGASLAVFDYRRQE